MAHAVACILRSVVGSLLSGLASPRALRVIRGMNLRVRWLGPPSFSWRAARRDSCFLALRGFRHSRAWAQLGLSRKNVFDGAWM